MVLSPIYNHVDSFSSLALMGNGHMDIWNMSFREYVYIFCWAYRLCIYSALGESDILPKWLFHVSTAGCESSVALDTQ